MTLGQRIGYGFYRLLGWRIEGEFPSHKKMLVIGAPHTSNWDFVFMVPYMMAMRVQIRFLGKDSLFRGPLGVLMRKLGGIPVQRGARLNAVEQAIQLFNTSDALILVMSPEGTRRKTDGWKSGFYHIARGANVPLVLGYLDYAGKRAGLGPSITLTGDTDADLARIAAFYADKRGKRPELETPARLATKSSPTAT
jgi:1-acyl-sn-glycerol-3-phosphate acyltransferase